VTATVAANAVTLKGAKGSLSLQLVSGVSVAQDKQTLTVQAGAAELDAIAGSTRAHLANMATGVSKGYDRKLELVGVGYRAAVQGKVLNLTLGFSHPVVFAIPDGIAIETPSQTEIVVKGVDRQLVGQVAAKIRGFRPPEPYKGKGVRYAGEKIELKEAKKK
jgi:large subunit ribosomal protein L6